MENILKNKDVICRRSSLKHRLQLVEVIITRVEGGTLETEAYTNIDPPDGRIDVTASGKVPPKVYFSVVALSYPRGILGIRCEVYRYRNDTNEYYWAEQMTTGFLPPLTDSAGNHVWQSIVDVSEMNGKPLVLDLHDTGVLHPLKLIVYAVEPNGGEMTVEAKYAMFQDLF